MGAYIFLVLILGLIAGSFLGAVSFRMQKGITFIRGRSFCPKCKSKIAWFDNIPLLSFLLLGGKCRKCKRKISLRYPLIEAATAIGFLGIYLLSCKVGGTASICTWKASLGGLFFPYLGLIFMLLILVFIIDLESQIIPDSLVFILIALTLLFLFLTPNINPFLYILSGFIGALFLLFLFLFTHGKGMGLGDVKLALFMGSFLGFPHVVSWLFMSFLLGAIVGIIMIIGKKATFGKHIAFGPFLVISFFIILIFGDKLLALFTF